MSDFLRQHASDPMRVARTLQEGNPRALLQAALDVIIPESERVLGISNAEDVTRLAHYHSTGRYRALSPDRLIIERDPWEPKVTLRYQLFDDMPLVEMGTYSDKPVRQAWGDWETASDGHWLEVAARVYYDGENRLAPIAPDKGQAQAIEAARLLLTLKAQVMPHERAQYPEVFDLVEPMEAAISAIDPAIGDIYQTMDMALEDLGRKGWMPADIETHPKWLVEHGGIAIQATIEPADYWMETPARGGLMLKADLPERPDKALCTLSADTQKDANASMADTLEDQANVAVSVLYERFGAEPLAHMPAVQDYAANNDRSDSAPSPLS